MGKRDGSVKRQKPWSKKRGPIVLESVRLDDIDHLDKTFQFRFTSDPQRLRRSMATNGGLDPVKLIAGKDSYRIVDGHTRVKAANDLGWQSIQALIYEGMSEMEAKAVAWRANVERANLSSAEKANAMQMALNDGFTRDEIAKIFGVARRTVDRYLELPLEVREHIDGTTITMAHGRILKSLVGVVPSEKLQELVAWVKATRAGGKELKNKLKEDGLIARRGKRQRFGIVKKGMVYGYRFEIGPRSTSQEQQEAIAFLKKAIEVIMSWHGDHVQR